MDIVLAVRRLRGERDIPPGRRVPLLLADSSKADQDRLQSYAGALSKIGRIASIQLLPPGAAAPDSAVAVVGGLKVMIPLAGLIDQAAERARLEKQIAQREQELQRSARKLASRGFVNKAPPAVVAKERARQQDLETQLSGLREQLDRLASL